MYLSPVSPIVLSGKGSIIEKTTFYAGEELERSEYDLAIVGVKESRNAADNEGCENAPEIFRKFFYQLVYDDPETSILDLGDIIPGESANDTLVALEQVIEECLRLEILPIIIGGSQDLSLANYKAYSNLDRVVNIVSVDHSFDLGDVEDLLSNHSYLSKIILSQPNFLFNFSNLGYQIYFVSSEQLELMDKLNFDHYRLGQVRADMQEVEPIVRNADMLTFDMSAIRHSDAPGNKRSTPNGFYGEEACQITRYAGLSDKLTSVGFYEYNPEDDQKGITGHLLAQMVWYFIEGYYQRKNDSPISSRKDFLKYTVATSQAQIGELVFYKNLKSDRWWMDVPLAESKMKKLSRHQLVPCSYSDYKMACNDELPDKWQKSYRKLY